MPLSEGQTFAGYRIVRLLGSGGMGEVYLAEHPRLPRRDALKVLRAEVSADPDYRARFNREADLASKLRHPHIVSVHDRGEHDGQLWISMDYIDGTDAARMTRDHYPAGMPPDEAVEIITAVAGALDFAHQQGLLHRDVKPANILLSQPDHDGERQVFLADFGIARELADPGGLTATNITVGTVAYAAPEQLMGLELDGHADQYALGATAFHLLSGAPPYQHSNPVAIIGQHLNAAIPKLGDRRPDLASFDHALSTALAKNPDQRFDSCRDFAKALREHVPTAPVGEHTTRVAAPHAAPIPADGHVDARRRPRISLRTVVLALIAVVLIGAIITVALLFTGLGGNPPAGPPNTVAAPPSELTTTSTTAEITTSTTTPRPLPSSWSGTWTYAGQQYPADLQLFDADPISGEIHISGWCDASWTEVQRTSETLRLVDAHITAEVATGRCHDNQWNVTLLLPYRIIGTDPTDPSTTFEFTPKSTPTESSTTSAPRPSLPGTDGQGWVGSYARCDPANPPALMAQTTKSLVVVCQAGPGNYYYRGVRMSDGASIELANAVRTSGGFDVTNPADGTRYQVRPDVLNIISPGGHVDSEPMVQYASS
ncbi:serine/threonine-protein kinase [Mycobacterium sp.]|uniref:serine/threonine-protein kinase n=1 Tax=Mycobacterium sp. TaxID=1785 RepID=UPI003F95323F